MSRETPVQTILKYAPIIITIGTVVVAFINALVFIQSTTLRDEIRSVQSQHNVFAQEFSDHKETQNKTEEQLLGELKEIKTDIKTLLQRR